MGVVVHIDHFDFAVGDLQQGDCGIVTVSHFLHPLGTDAQELRHSVADESAVGENRHRLIGVLGSYVQNGGHASPADFWEALAAGGPEVGGGGGEEPHHGVVRPVKSRPGTVLPFSHAQLPQVGAGLERQTLGNIDGPGGGHGPEQVAGIHRVNGDIGKAFLQGLDLPVAVVGDETVILAVDAAVQVSLRLGVSNEVQCCHAFSSGSVKNCIVEMITLHYIVTHIF